MAAGFRPMADARDRTDALALIAATLAAAGAEAEVARGTAAEFLDERADVDIRWLARDDADELLAVFVARAEVLTPDDDAYTYRMPRRLASPLFGLSVRPGGERKALRQLATAMANDPAAHAAGPLSIEVARSATALAAALESHGMRPNALHCVASTDSVLASSRGGATPTIRRATSDDLTQISALAAEESRYQAMETRSGTSVAQCPATLERIATQWLADPNVAVFLAELDSGAGGMIVVEAVVNEAGSPEGVLVDGPHGYISVLSVTARERGSGVGGALVSAAANWTSDRGLSRLALHAIADNRLSVPFWTRRGFEAVAVEYLGTLETSSPSSAR